MKASNFLRQEDEQLVPFVSSDSPRSTWELCNDHFSKNVVQKGRFTTIQCFSQAIKAISHVDLSCHG